jgi:hypothetical protein
MEIRQNIRRVPNSAIVFLFVILTAVALGLVGWRGLAAGSGSPAPTFIPQASTTGFEGPDAQERNAQLRLDETTHGH